jgi:alpha-tubulin suppressor-like RCC1 family protein
VVGNNSRFDQKVPVKLTGTWRSVSVGQHACAIAPNGDLFCWGANDNDECGDSGATNPVLAPKFVSSNWSTVAASSHHTCAIGDTSNVLYCWGQNTSGQCGQNPATPKVGGPSAPVIGQNTGAWSAVATGDATTCGVDMSGDVECWGAAGLGQLGDGTNVTRYIPMLASGPIAAASDGVGGLFACSANPNLYCWGYDDNGQLGNQTTNGSYTPEQIPGNWLEVSTGSVHACGILSDRTLWCWGDNHWGQLGDGTFYSEHMPVQIGTDLWQHVSAGTDHTCAVRTDNTVWCWGSNGSGQIGDGLGWRSELTPTH